jgi:hypothetical protein
MDDEAIRAALERHWTDVNDQDVVHEIYHDDVVLEFPQGASDSWVWPTCGPCEKPTRNPCR